MALVCAKCGTKQTHDVGTIFIAEEAKGDDRFQFTNYFRCLQCDSPGPFEIADYLKLMAELLAGKTRKNPKMYLGRAELFDGSAYQTPAMGEVHLKELIAKDPANAFLHVRLGNLLRASGREGAAEEWYRRAMGLDPQELEALGSSNELALKRDDYGTVLRQARTILEAIGAGRRAGTDELTHALLTATLYRMNERADQFRFAWNGQSDEFRESPIGRILHEFMDMGADLDEEVGSFVDAALGEEDDDDPVADEFEADEEPDGDPGPSQRRGTRTGPPKVRSGELEPSLAAVVADKGLVWDQLSVVFPVRGASTAASDARYSIRLTDDKHEGTWTVPSLRALFRGDRQPPPEKELEHYPEESVDLFYGVESHVELYVDTGLEPTDEEFIEIYSTMRRRPDGKSLGPLHDAVWQAACLALALRKVSEAEFNAMFGQLTRSVRHFRIGHPSRNYIEYLRSTFG